MTAAHHTRRLGPARPRLLVALTIASLAGLLAVPLSGRAATPTGPAFTRHAVDTTLAGGEPEVTYYSNAANGADLAYTSHEGTTHLFRDGLISPDTSNICSMPGQSTPSGFACSYTNEVNVWTSTDQGKTWQRTTVGPNGVGPTSAFGLGFSDPDWSTDEGGYLYDTGIDLANDSVFASQDGGRSFPIGNNNCHSGDRPWLAGGKAGEVFLATDTTVDANTGLSSGHEIFQGVVTPVGPVTTLQCFGAAGSLIPNDPSGATGPGIMDFGNSSAPAGGTYSAAGKLFYDHNAGPYQGALVDPALFTNKDNSAGVGISILPKADAAFAAGSTVSQFPQQFEVPGTNGTFATWPSIAIDANDIVYLTWDTDTGASAGKLNNAIKLSTFDLKNTAAGFSAPITIAAPGKSVLWPWVAVPTTAAGAGNASVVWYQYDTVTNPDQGTGNLSLFETNVFGVRSGSPTLLGPVDAAGGPIHSGGTCQSGTTCVATGQDRRLGDFFTNAIDQNGCVMIASGETMTDPSAATSRPIFMQQTGGSSLTGGTCGALAAAVPEAPLLPLLVVGGVVLAILGSLRRRTRAAA